MGPVQRNLQQSLLTDGIVPVDRGTGSITA